MNSGVSQSGSSKFNVIIGALDQLILKRNNSLLVLPPIRHVVAERIGGDDVDLGAGAAEFAVENPAGAAREQRAGIVYAI